MRYAITYAPHQEFLSPFWRWRHEVVYQQAAFPGLAIAMPQGLVFAEISLEHAAVQLEVFPVI
jgi:hypothetical protein